MDGWMGRHGRRQAGATAVNGWMDGWVNEVAMDRGLALVVLKAFGLMSL